ncbi:MAG TPA: FtsX-like permease family protein, partial [Acidimicrobiales bacterium]|nr:FtsX-like permease family protein [Acidimicrobiales bacterium]
GQRVRVLLAGPSRTFTITGLVRFGTADNLAGATIAAFTLPTAQKLFGEVGQLDAINVVTSPGANKAAVERDIARHLPRGVQVVTGQTVVNEQTNDINQALSFFSTALVIFALISLFVGAFTILNTFSIIVGQRTRELALLRIVGARRQQIFRSVLLEAGLVGLVSSLVGLGLGVLAAYGIEALLKAFGFDLPAGPLAFEPRTVVIALAVGTGVTVVAAISPARRAVRIPPVAAINDMQELTDVSFRRRFAWGASLALSGAAVLGAGLAAAAVALVGLGAVLLFVGVAMLAPAIARRLAGVVGRPLAGALGVAGRLGRENSMRSPRRTAQTASALMVGLALVSAIAVFGASASGSTTSSVDDAVRADLLVLPTNSNGSGSIATTVPAAVSHLPGVVTSTTVFGGQFEFRQSLETLAAISTRGLSATVILDLTSGSLSALGRGEMLIDSNTAQADHLRTGDTVAVKFARTGNGHVRIGGIFEPNALIGSYVASEGYYDAHFVNPQPGGVLLKTDGSSSVQREVQRALAPYPNVQVQTRAQFENTQSAQVNQLLGIVYALLALAVLIALIGIVNTLMLSVFERTHEIGLLRAVGMKRRQVRAMIRSESVIIAVFGAIIGIVIGTGLGIALVSSLHSQGITKTVVPGESMIVFLILSALLGLLAASWPARRAAKLDVLAAIAAQ